MPPEGQTSSSPVWRHASVSFVLFKRSGSLALAVAILSYLVLTGLASARLFWHDELYTLYIATAPTWQRFWQEVRLDLNPPLHYLAVRASTALLGQSGYAVRLPSIVGYLVGSLCLYRFIALNLNAWYGLLAMLVFWANPFFYYATEARPYALVIGFLGLSLLCWQQAIRRERAVTPVLLLALSVTGMMLSHMMSLLYITPLCLAEAVRAYRLRKIDLRIWAALLLPCALPFIYMHLVERFNASIFPPAFRASPRKIVEAYYGSLRVAALPLLFALLLAWFTSSYKKRDEARQVGRITVIELALIAGFLALPALVNLALMRTHGAYFERYALPVAFGYGLGVAFFLASRVNVSNLAPMAASAVLLLFVIAFNLGSGLKQSVWAHRGSGSTLTGGTLDRTMPQLPLVTASGLTFLEMDHYESEATVRRLYYLTDQELAVRYAGATIFEGLQTVKGYFPIRAHVTPYRDFVAAHPVFLVLGTPDYPEDWLLRALLAMQEDVRYLGELPVPYKDTQLYEVTVSERPAR
jgi:4-amino-4-deoxy-L-arabinose transferase-like glycosyltransferase